jgi:serine/threonine protein kinase
MNEKRAENQDFQKLYPLIFKKYRTIKKIANGAFSEIYFGINISNKEKVAIKIENRNKLNRYLQSESFILYSLKNIGIPKVLSFGHNKEYDILIMPLLGKSLKELYFMANYNFNFKDVCLIAIQIMERIEWVHSHNIIHRDIKPENFLIGLTDPNILYIIDFGLSKKYRSSTTGKHIKCVELKRFTGNVKYASINALSLKEQSRKDDLESIGYMLIYLIKGSLPWQNIKVINKRESYYRISNFKKNINVDKMCENLPIEFIYYMKYVRNLGFEETPDYSYLKALFQIILKKQGLEVEKIYFSWVNENNIKNLGKQVDLNKRSSCSRERIYKKIKKNLDTQRSYSQNNPKFINNLTIHKENTEISSSKKGNEIKVTQTEINNYLNNSVNNNFISISVSIPGNKANFEQRTTITQRNDKQNLINMNSLSSHNFNPENDINQNYNSEINFNSNMKTYEHNFNENIMSYDKNTNNFYNSNYHKFNTFNNNRLTISTNPNNDYQTTLQNNYNLLNSHYNKFGGVKQNNNYNLSMNSDNKVQPQNLNSLKSFINRKIKTLKLFNLSPVRDNQTKEGKIAGNQEAPKKINKINLKGNNNNINNIQKGNILKNKVNKIVNQKTSHTNKSVDYTKLRKLKKVKGKYRYKPHDNNNNNCSIF